eukprot:TRINITY_DN8541_c0_g1_i1.p3 TRINITY_DN8541_c0_g1~~TRINITY_DN8541_c0_g1_i1.p3  ORF type:complete len:178 (+),score=37.47 TRINITY_DN8541_c0_g1_i1:1-534(+)
MLCVDSKYRISCMYRNLFFFFKQKTAYEISACLVGSEMCIRDRSNTQNPLKQYDPDVSIKSFNDKQIRELEKLLVDRYDEKTNLKPQTLYKQDNQYGNSLIKQLKEKKVDKVVQILKNELQLSHKLCELEPFVVNDNQVGGGSKKLRPDLVNKLPKFIQNQPSDKPEIKTKKLIRKI